MIIDNQNNSTMRHLKTLLILSLCIIGLKSAAQDLPVQLQELTAVQFKDAVKKSSETVIIPMGVLEKHGPHMPLGTDVYTAREIALQAAEKEYAVVFPWYYFGRSTRRDSSLELSHIRLNSSGKCFRRLLMS